MYDGLIQRCNGLYGAVYIEGKGAGFELNGGTIDKCGKIPDKVGGIYMYDHSELLINGGTISNCAGTKAGAVYFYVAPWHFFGTFTFGMVDGLITNNFGGDAGGIYVEKAKVMIRGGVVKNNNSTGNGGGMSIVDCSDQVNITGGEFTGNRSGGYGGGIYFQYVELFMGKDCTVTRNTARWGGGIYLDNWHRIVLKIWYRYMELQKGLKLCNNIATVAASDIYAVFTENVQNRFRLEAWTMKEYYQNSGHLIDGWYSDDKKSPYHEENPGNPISADDLQQMQEVSLIAAYGTPKPLKVSYQFVGDVPEGAVVPASETVYYGNAYTARQPDEVSGYSFTGWYTDSLLHRKYVDGSVMNTNLYLYGKWLKDYTVSYEFKSKDERVLPEAVTKLTPRDDKHYRSASDIVLIQPEETAVRTGDEIWLFDKYSTSIDEDARKVTVTGSWEPAAVEKYHVHYKFESAAESVHSLPAEVMALLPDDDKSYVDWEKVKAKKPSAVEVDDAADGHNWKFKGYDKDTATIQGEDVTFTGSWKPSYRAGIIFKSRDGSELPQEVLDECPVIRGTFTEGEVVKPVYPKDTTVITKEGKTWSFVSYDVDEITIDDHYVYFLGTWEQKGKDHYSVYYEFESGTSGMYLPSDVMKWLPADKNTYMDGEEAEVIDPAVTTVITWDEAGSWSFEGYEGGISGKVTIHGKDVKLVGKWTYTAYTKYKVSYIFKSGTEGMELPQMISEYLLPSEEIHSDGDGVTPAMPVRTEVKVKNGSWSFDSYSPEKATIAGKDVLFTGTWTFRKDPSKYHKLIYRFKSEDETQLPQAVLDQYPVDEHEYAEGEFAVPVDPGEIEVETEAGCWVFLDYVPAVSVVGEEESTYTFTGSWYYCKYHHVSYEFASGTSGMSLPDAVTSLKPIDDSEYYSGELAYAIEPQISVVEVKGGYWSFEGYDNSSIFIEDEDAVFTGTWTYTEEPGPAPEEEYHVNYWFISGTEGRELPKAVTALLPEDKGRYKTGTTVKPKAPSRTKVSVSGGSWSFAGYDKESAVVDAADIDFVGSWIYSEITPDPGKGGDTHNRGSEALGYDTGSSIYRGWYKDSTDGSTAGIWYYYDENGVLVKGWHFDMQDGRWYYLSLTDGHMLTGWQLINGKWYYLNPTAPEQTWDYDGSKWVYNGSASRPYGSMYSAELTPDGYMTGSDGAMR